jgi:hypothetical protein
LAARADSGRAIERGRAADERAVEAVVGLGGSDDAVPGRDDKDRALAGRDHTTRLLLAASALAAARSRYCFALGSTSINRRSVWRKTTPSTRTRSSSEPV